MSIIDPDPFAPRFLFDSLPVSQMGAPIQKLSPYIEIDGVRKEVKPGEVLHIYVDASCTTDFTEVVEYYPNDVVHLTQEGLRHYRQHVRHILGKLYPLRRAMSKRAYYRLRGYIKAQRRQSRLETQAFHKELKDRLHGKPVR